MNSKQLFINYGKDYSGMTYELMKAANIKDKLNPKMKVVLKPNLVVAKEARYGATTHSEIAHGIIQYLIENGIKDITIAEGSWVGVGETMAAFKKCGFEDLVKKYKDYNIKLLDTKNDPVITAKARGVNLDVCRTVYEADYLINIPVLKGHCQTKITCCLKNMKGCIPDSEKRRYHKLGLTKPIALLNTILKPDLHIVDSVCGDLDFEEGGNPVQSDRIILGFDPVLIDSYGAALLGYKPDEVGYLKLAQEYGIGLYTNDKIEIVELNSENKPSSAKSSGKAARLSVLIDEKNACSACYANLIFALNKINISSLQDKIKIGQGYRGVQSRGVGVGNCTKGCEKNINGCPPTAVDIIEFLNENCN